MKVQSM